MATAEEPPAEAKNMTQPDWCEKHTCAIAPTPWVTVSIDGVRRVGATASSCLRNIEEASKYAAQTTRHHKPVQERSELDAKSYATIVSNTQTRRPTLGALTARRS